MNGRRPRGPWAALALFALVTGACGNAPPSGQPLPQSPAVGTAAPSGTPSGTPSDTPVASGRPSVAFPGLYLGRDLSVNGDDAVVVLRGAMDCTEMADLIEAGEWTVTRRETARGSGGSGSPAVMTMLALERGEETALAMLAGGSTCAARVSRTTRATIRATGALTLDGPMPYNEPMCVTMDTDVALYVVYRGSAGPAVSIAFKAPARVGSTVLTPDDIEITVERGPMTDAELAQVMIGAFRDSEGGQFTEVYTPTEAATSVLDVTTVSPFAATLRVTGFDGPRGRLDLEATVGCHLPGSVLRLAGESATKAALATPSPTAPTPSLGPIATAPPATLIASGGAIAGTYAVPQRNLTCFRDDEAGAWSMSTSGVGAPDFSLFVTVATPKGGGSSERVVLGLIVGDGSGDRIATVDTTTEPSVGVAEARVAVKDGLVTVQVAARSTEGVAIAANLSCRP